MLTQYVFSFLIFVIALPAMSFEKNFTFDKDHCQILFDCAQVKKCFPFNKVFTLKFEIACKNHSAIKLTMVDARMPAHNHGMVTVPSIREVKPNVFAIEGIKLHMEGQWRFFLKFKSEKNETSEFSFDYDLSENF